MERLKVVTLWVFQQEEGREQQHGGADGEDVNGALDGDHTLGLPPPAQAQAKLAKSRTGGALRRGGLGRKGHVNLQRG